MKTVLVTGINGFVGHHLAHRLQQQGHRVFGTGIDPELDPSLSGVVDSYFGKCDLTSGEAVARLPLKELDAVVNLAGLAQVGSSFGKEALYLRINVQVHTTLLRQLQLTGSKARVLAVSTGAVYDNNQPMPISETSRLISQGSPYALSKIAMEEALTAFIADGMDVVIVRPFNHIGPGQLSGFLVPDLTAKVIGKDTVTVGNLDTARDYTDVRDVVAAYTLLATLPKLKHRLYNICSGKKVRGKEILRDILLAAEEPDIDVKVDPDLMRPNDPPVVAGDNSRLRNDTGWQPTIPIEQTIKDFVDWYKAQN